MHIPENIARQGTEKIDKYVTLKSRAEEISNKLYHLELNYFKCMDDIKENFLVKRDSYWGNEVRIGYYSDKNEEKVKVVNSNLSQKLDTLWTVNKQFQEIALDLIQLNYEFVHVTNEIDQMENEPQRELFYGHGIY